MRWTRLRLPLFIPIRGFYALRNKPRATDNEILIAVAFSRGSAHTFGKGAVLNVVRDSALESDSSFGGGQLGVHPQHHV